MESQSATIITFLELGRYNDKHPLGNKYRIKELKKIRDQAYEDYTQHLVLENRHAGLFLRTRQSIVLRSQFI
jgi:hypothetical protein